MPSRGVHHATALGVTTETLDREGGRERRRANQLEDHQRHDKLDQRLATTAADTHGHLQ